MLLKFNPQTEYPIAPATPIVSCSPISSLPSHCAPSHSRALPGAPCPLLPQLPLSSLSCTQDSGYLLVLMFPSLYLQPMYPLLPFRCLQALLYLTHLKWNSPCPTPNQHSLRGAMPPSSVQLPTQRSESQAPPSLAFIHPSLTFTLPLLWTWVGSSLI